MRIIHELKYIYTIFVPMQLSEMRYNLSVEDIKNCSRVWPIDMKGGQLASYICTGTHV
jgi:hypothetical protein